MADDFDCLGGDIHDYMTYIQSGGDDDYTGDDVEDVDDEDEFGDSIDDSDDEDF